MRIMTYLAMRYGEAAPARKREISLAEGISADYVEQILMRLKTHGLVSSFRGRGSGGFTLARPAASITAADVLDAAEGPMALAPCAAGDCKRSGRCAIRGLWSQAGGALEGVLRGRTLADLAAESRDLDSSHELSFEI